MRLKIISDGNCGPGTKIIDMDTGEELKCATSVTWSMSGATGVAIAEVTLEVPFAEIEVETDGRYGRAKREATRWAERLRKCRAWMLRSQMRLALWLR